MKRLLFLTIIALAGLSAAAQPKVRRAQAAAKKAQAASGQMTRRAQLMFPTAIEMPEDVVWRRDIYRSLDLTKDANAALYYPQEPDGDRMNLFTYLFKLILRGQIKAYDYGLDGNENFAASNQVKGKDLMDRYQIYYESKDGRIKVNDSDLPSAEVLSYYIKESAYFDQRTSTYHTKVTALCPVLKRADEFGSGATLYPMFWVKYDDVSPYLAKLPLMGSNLNNAATLSADDYFAMNRYEGTIYKTNNLQGKVLANYCTTDSALKKEEKRIEKELADFERHVWGTDSVPNAEADSVLSADQKNEKEKPNRRRSTSSRRRSSSEKKEKAQKVNTKTSGPATPRVTVRRQRH